MKNKYQYLFDDNPIPIWVIDLKTYQFLDVNKAALIQYGYTREEFLSMSAIDISPSEEKERFRQINIPVAAINNNIGIWRHTKKNGSIISVEILANRISFEEKQAMLFLCNDATEKINAEKRIFESIKEISDYKYALDESSIVAITDQKGIIKHANNNFCRISKYSREELIGQDHRIINSAYHSKEFIRNLWVTIANGKIWRGELKNKAKDGTIYWVDTTIIPFLNEHGKPYQYVAIRADITDRKSIEENLGQTLKEISDYKYALDESSIVAITDQKGIIKHANDNFCKISKYSREELIGQDHRIINSGYHPKEFIRNLWVTIANGKIWRGDLKNKAKDGSTYWVATTIIPFLNEKGKPYQYVAIRSDITQQKESEEKIIASEKRFRHTLDNMMGGAQMHDFNWRYLYVNDTLAKYSKASKEELIGYTLMEKFPGIEQTDLFKVMNRCMLERISAHFETEFVFPDGTKEFFELNIQPIPEGIFIFSIDVTEQKKAREKILKGNRLYSFLSHINQTIVHIKDEQTLFHEACRIAVMLGEFKMAWIGLLDKEGILNIVNMNGDESVVGEFKKHSQMDFSNPILRNTPTGKALSTGKYSANNDVQNDRAMLPWKDEFVKHSIKSIISLPITKFGKIIGIFGLSSVTENFFDKEEIDVLVEAAGDISFGLENFDKDNQRKKAEENLKKSESRLNEAQAIALIGGWEIDLVNNTQSWSKELYNMYGLDYNILPSTELFYSFMHPDDVAFAMRKVEEIFLTYEDTAFDFRFIKQNGEVRYGSSIARFEFDKSHKPVRLYGIVKDITQQKHAEEEREKFIKDIIQRNENLEQFTYIVSHNLRAPVANIIGYSDAMKDTGFSEEERTELINGISASVQKLDEVIEDLNHILQIRNNLNEHKEIIIFSQLVEGIKFNISNLIANIQVEINCNFSAVNEFYSIKSYFFSIFYNLITNSIKYRRPDIPLVISIKSRKSRNKIELIFKDNGMGIDLQKNKENLFGLYKRFHPQLEGKGMGLFMVKAQVESLGGKIKIQSEVNEGTKFTIEFEVKP